jgi:type VI secretion system protein ImpJ
MSWQKKVVWSEGMFLKPQHFQQQERYFEFFSHARSLPMEGFFWGFRELSLDMQAMSLGKVAITSAQGVFPDGTPFHFPAQGKGPNVLEIPANAKNQRIVLALPIRRHGTDEVSFDNADDTLARYQVSEIEVEDTNSVRATESLLQLADLRLQLLLESDLTDGWMALGVAFLVERKSNNFIELENKYIPPTLACGKQTVLQNYNNEILGLLHQRGDVLAARLSQPGRGGVSEVADFLMLELLNRWEPLIKHVAHIETAHPERLYAMFLQLAGDLSTFSKESRRPDTYPHYDHGNLRSCFEPLMLDLRQSLSMVIEQNAIQIELLDRSHGIKLAIMPSAELVKAASFILAVHASMPSETVRSNFPTQVKIGPAEKIRDLVNFHLPGVALRALPVAPRQIPYNAGYNYFELDTEHELWKLLPRSGGLAIHIAGEFPGLQLEFWAIRQ